MKKVKMLFALMAMIMTMGLIASCGDEGKNGNDNGNGNNPIITNGTISGKLKIYEEKYNPEIGDYEYLFKADATDEVDEIVLFTAVYDGNYDEDIELGRGSVANGEFSFKLPTPSNEYLEMLSKGMPDGITISDKTVKILNSAWFRGYKNDEYIGYIDYEISSLSSDLDVDFVYVDKDVKITGTSEEYDEEDDERDIDIYNIDMKKGWNTLVIRGTAEGNKYTSKYTANETLSNMIWTMNLYSSDNIPSKSQKERIPRNTFLK